ncbi:MAG: tetratricopeptide repeat protein, partial [bacterium]
MSELWSLILLLMVALLGVIGIWWINREHSRKPSVEENYLKGLEAMVEGRWKDAVKNFLETIRVDTSHIEAYLRLGEALRKLGKLQKTLQIHKELANRNDLPKATKNRVIQELALDWEQMGEISKA